MIGDESDRPTTVRPRGRGAATNRGGRFETFIRLAVDDVTLRVLGHGGFEEFDQLIPIRVGAGLRLGVNAGYMKFSEKRNWLPF